MARPDYFRIADKPETTPFVDQRDFRRRSRSEAGQRPKRLLGTLKLTNAARNDHRAGGLGRLASRRIELILSAASVFAGSGAISMFVKASLPEASYRGGCG